MSEPPFADLSNMTAVVTGASSGIGREIALEFARAGAEVLVHCRRSVTKTESLVAEIRSLGRTAHLVTADVSDPAGLPVFVQNALNCLGKIDIWVNNAGVDLLTGPEAQLGYQEKLELLFSTDIRSTMLLSKHVGELMQQAGSGAILNIGWDQADRGMEGDSGELFAATKNSIMGFTRSHALSLAPAVRVNCIAPGWIRTAWGEKAGDTWQNRVRAETPLDRWGTPADVAKLARFLVSPDASYITGQVVNANGGAVR